MFGCSRHIGLHGHPTRYVRKGEEDLKNELYLVGAVRADSLHKSIGQESAKVVRLLIETR
jgi:hypothetical protein